MTHIMTVPVIRALDRNGNPEALTCKQWEIIRECVIFAERYASLKDLGCTRGEFDTLQEILDV